MGIADFTFYMFALSVILGGLFTVTSKNPVHSVLWLILAFLSSAGLFVMLGAEFVAMLLIIVYVGAVAVLFLFVVMMLDVDFAELKAEMAKYVPIAGLIGVVLLMQLSLAFGSWQFSDGIDARLGNPTPPLEDMHNTQALGALIYDQYFLLFQLSGLILLVAMIGAIVLTLRQRPGVKKQNIGKQVSRRREDSVELKKVQPGQGI